MRDVCSEEFFGALNLKKVFRSGTLQNFFHVLLPLCKDFVHHLSEIVYANIGERLIAEVGWSS